MNLSCPHFEAHKNFIRGIDEDTCRFMSSLSVDEDVCTYIRFTPSCHESDNYFDYLSLSLCTMAKYINMNFTSATITLLCIAAMYGFMLACLTLTAIPNMISLMKYFTLSEHNAGATLLVMIDGIPDIISTFFFYEGDTEMLVNEMIGTGTYLRAFHVGILIWLNPTTLLGSDFSRDQILYTMGLAALFIILLERKETSLYSGLVAMIFYPALCIAVYFDHRKALKARKAANHKEITEDMERYLELTKPMEIIRYTLTSHEHPLDVGIWKQFIIVMNPFENEMYQNFSKWQKNLVRFGIIFVIPYKLVVPIVNLMIPGDGWSRLLLFFNFLLSPLLLTLHPSFNLENWRILIYVGVFMAIMVFLCTSTHSPKLQFPLAMYGMVCNMLIVNVLSNEIISLLVDIGNILGIERPLIGSTFLAWGNTIPEVIVYCSLVRWHHKRIPIVSFLMAPLLNCVFSMGLTMCLKAAKERSLTVAIRPGAEGTTAQFIAIIHHIMFCFAVLTTNFHLRKSVGIFSIALYLIFGLYTCMQQLHIMHPYGTDHVDEQMFVAATWA